MSVPTLAKNLGVAPSTLSRIVTGKSGVSPEMALRLSKALGRSPESWLAMQGMIMLFGRQNSTPLSSQSDHTRFD